MVGSKGFLDHSEFEQERKMPNSKTVNIFN